MHTDRVSKTHSEVPHTDTHAHIYTR